MRDRHGRRIIPLPENAMKIGDQIAIWLDRFLKRFKPKPLEMFPCVHCDKPTSRRERGEYIHWWCEEVRNEIAAQKREERDKIDLIKQAIMELKHEGEL